VHLFCTVSPSRMAFPNACRDRAKNRTTDNPTPCHWSPGTVPSGVPWGLRDGRSCRSALQSFIPTFAFFCRERPSPRWLSRGMWTTMAIFLPEEEDIS